MRREITRLFSSSMCMYLLYFFTLLISSMNEYFNVLNDKKMLNSVNIKKCRNLKSLMFFENFEKYQIFCDKNLVTGGNKLTM